MNNPIQDSAYILERTRVVQAAIEWFVAHLAPYSNQPLDGTHRQIFIRMITYAIAEGLVREGFDVTRDLEDILFDRRIRLHFLRVPLRSVARAATRSSITFNPASRSLDLWVDVYSTRFVGSVNSEVNIPVGPRN